MTVVFGVSVTIGNDHKPDRSVFLSTTVLIYELEIIVNHIDGIHMTVFIIGIQCYKHLLNTYVYTYIFIKLLNVVYRKTFFKYLFVRQPEIILIHCIL